MQYLGAISLPRYNVINIDVIYPATEKHVSKHSAQAYILVQESPELYAKATVPFMQAIPASRLGWVANILEKKVCLLFCPLSNRSRLQLVESLISTLLISEKVSVASLCTGAAG